MSGAEMGFRHCPDDYRAYVNDCRRTAQDGKMLKMHNVMISQYRGPIGERK
jgi:hypothetical protein